MSFQGFEPPTSSQNVRQEHLHTENDRTKFFEKNTDWLEGLFSLGKWLNSAAQYFSESQKTIKR